MGTDMGRPQQARRLEAR
uniref:Uncharacterized protein n=1 Tax=Arundo donax TaxID=35708 RepID=A0A0A8ZA27_ARUDO